MLNGIQWNSGTDWSAADSVLREQHGGDSSYCGTGPRGTRPDRSYVYRQCRSAHAGERPAPELAAGTASIAVHHFDERRLLIGEGNDKKKL